MSAAVQRSRSHPKPAIRLERDDRGSRPAFRAGHGPFAEVTVRPIRIPRLPLTIVAVIAAVTACSGPAPSNTASNPALAKAPPATYYLALGDSLAQGVQPNAAGVSVMTSDGYPDQVYAALHPSRPGLKLVKLGCPSETTASMINGGICRYRDGSQLAAVGLQEGDRRGRVLLVTLDIGANDPEHCGGEPGLGQLAKCAVKDVPAAVGNLGTIITRLKAAAGPGVRIVGMTYYLPALAEWRNGLPGHVVAWTAEKLAATYNRLLTRAYAKSGVRVANVFGAFDTSDFTRPAGTNVPRNVDRLCQWTWQCAAPPRGPNQHAKQAGYRVIARAFLQASGLS
jgi:lysophospholipase L1-like esterase